MDRICTPSNFGSNFSAAAPGDPLTVTVEALDGTVFTMQIYVSVLISGVLGFYFRWFPRNSVRLLALFPGTHLVCPHFTAGPGRHRRRGRSV